MPLAASSGTERSAQVSAFFTLPEELRHAVFRASERGDVRSMGGGALLLTDAQRVLRLVCRDICRTVGAPRTLTLDASGLRTALSYGSASKLADTLSGQTGKTTKAANVSEDIYATLLTVHATLHANHSSRVKTKRETSAILQTLNAMIESDDAVLSGVQDVIFTREKSRHKGKQLVERPFASAQWQSFLAALEARHPELRTHYESQSWGTDYEAASPVLVQVRNLSVGSTGDAPPKIRYHRPEDKIILSWYPSTPPKTLAGRSRDLDAVKTFGEGFGKVRHGSECFVYVTDSEENQGLLSTLIQHKSTIRESLRKAGFALHLVIRKDIEADHGDTTLEGVDVGDAAE